MDVREKLVELLKSILPNFRNNMTYWGEKPIYEFADCLLANGVTVQEWISVNDRLPEDRGYYLVAYQDKYNENTSITLDMYVMCGAGEWWTNEFTHNITHWMPLPEVPKKEE